MVLASWFQFSSSVSSPLVAMGLHGSSSSVSSGRQSFFAGFCSSALRRKSIGSLTDSADGHGGGLVRRLGLFELILIGIGASIGAGIFVVTGTVARDAGPGVTISFSLAGAACVLNAMCYAELSARFPAVVGGAYLYTYAAFNELTAFLVFTQLMLDYHIGAASIARSLASYFISLLELFPFFKGSIPSWIGHGGIEFFGGVVSINVLAPIFLVILTVILCFGVKESSTVNSFMTATKVAIIFVVIFAGAFEVDVSNWSPFAPNGIKAIVTGATVVFFSYIGFDAVANSAEESKHPQRDLPIGILGSLLVCAILYIGVCLVITGMVPYKFLGEEAPLAEAFTAKGLKFVAVLISIGAVAGLTTTLLVGLYVQSRLYLGLARDGLLPNIFSKVHAVRHTPIHSQAWVGFVAIIMAGLFNVHQLSHILSVGTLTSYSIVSACVITLRWKDKVSNRLSGRWISAVSEGTLCLVTVAFCGFLAGVYFRFGGSSLIILFVIIIAVLGTLAVQFRQEYADPPGFSCPGVPIVPLFSIFFNMLLCAQLHEEAWYRFIIVNLIAVVFYAIYGQYSANTVSSGHSIAYHGIPSETT